jgi:hypothetical protein
MALLVDIFSMSGYSRVGYEKKGVTVTNYHIFISSILLKRYSMYKRQVISNIAFCFF